VAVDYYQIIHFPYDVLSSYKGGAHMSAGYGAGFALLVVLFILLIIVGASGWNSGGYGGGAGYGGGYGYGGGFWR
jgi:uncharacterized protein (TIGR01732 family)